MLQVPDADVMRMQLQRVVCVRSLRSLRLRTFPEIALVGWHQMGLCYADAPVLDGRLRRLLNRCTERLGLQSHRRHGLDKT